MPATTLRYTRITGLTSGDTALIRSASMAGVSYVVVPVVMLVGNSVVRPMNSLGPEFVPAEELNFAVGSWNGRPILPDHPDNGTASANDPSTLEKYAFGYVFNARYDDGKLKAEAWLDPVRAALVGADALSVIKRCKAGEMVEVSIGAWVEMEERSGVYNGQPYEFIWHSPYPDHLAMLPKGVPGACSVEMGCGAPRLNRAFVSAASDDEITGDDLMTLRDLIRQLFTPPLVNAAQEKGYSDNDLRRTLENLLFNTVPAFMGVQAIYPDSKTVIYMTSGEDGYKYWRQSYKAYGDSFKLSDDAEEVVQQTTFVPASEANSADKSVVEVKIKVDTEPIEKATAAVAELKAACGCQNGDGQTLSHSASEATAAPANVDKEAIMPAENVVKDAVGRLLAHARSPWKEEHRAFLESLSADHLKQLEESIPAEVKPETVVEKPVEAAPVTKSEEELEAEFMAKAPESLKRFFAQAKQAEADERNTLISALAKNQTVFTEAQLKAKTTEDLVGLSKLLKLDQPVSFAAARFVPAAASTSGGDDDIYRNPPNPWDVKSKASA